jgi:hypothetical protein
MSPLMYTHANLIQQVLFVKDSHLCKSSSDPLNSQMGGFISVSNDSEGGLVFPRIKLVYAGLCDKLQLTTIW